MTTSASTADAGSSPGMTWQQAVADASAVLSKVDTFGVMNQAVAAHTRGIETSSAAGSAQHARDVDRLLDAFKSQSSNEQAITLAVACEIVLVEGALKVGAERAGGRIKLRARLNALEANPDSVRPAAATFPSRADTGGNTSPAKSVFEPSLDERMLNFSQLQSLILSDLEHCRTLDDYAKPLAALQLDQSWVLRMHESSPDLQRINELLTGRETQGMAAILGSGDASAAELKVLVANLPAGQSAALAVRLDPQNPDAALAVVNEMMICVTVPRGVLSAAPNCERMTPVDHGKDVTLPLVQSSPTDAPLSPLSMPPAAPVAHPTASQATVDSLRLRRF